MEAPGNLAAFDGTGAQSMNRQDFLLKRLTTELGVESLVAAQETA